MISNVSQAASFMLDLSVRPDSKIVNYEASGSVTVTSAVASLSSLGGSALPVSGTWSTAYDDNIGDALGIFSGALNDDLLLTNGGVTLFNNGFSIALFDTIDLDPSGSTGADDIELDNTTAFTGPSLVAGDILSWSGTGTFTLESKNFGSVFLLGAYSNTIDDGSFVVTITSVPEPRHFGLLVGVLVGAVALLIRKRALVCGYAEAAILIGTMSVTNTCSIADLIENLVE